MGRTVGSGHAALGDGMLTKFSGENEVYSVLYVPPRQCRFVHVLGHPAASPARRSNMFHMKALSTAMALDEMANSGCTCFNTINTYPLHPLTPSSAWLPLRCILPFFLFHFFLACSSTVFLLLFHAILSFRDFFRSLVCFLFPHHHPMALSSIHFPLFFLPFFLMICSSMLSLKILSESQVLEVHGKYHQSLRLWKILLHAALPLHDSFLWFLICSLSPHYRIFMAASLHLPPFFLPLFLMAYSGTFSLVLFHETLPMTSSSGPLFASCPSSPMFSLANIDCLFSSRNKLCRIRGTKTRMINLFDLQELS